MYVIETNICIFDNKIVDLQSFIFNIESWEQLVLDINNKNFNKKYEYSNGLYSKIFNDSTNKEIINIEIKENTIKILSSLYKDDEMKLKLCDEEHGSIYNMEMKKIY